MGAGSCQSSEARLFLLGENVSIELGTLLICPNGIQGQAPLQIELSRVLQAEARLGEIARVNIETAPPLLALFNEAYLDLGRALAELKLQHAKAVRTANVRKSMVMLDVAPRC
jgi:hypothetical protein